MIVLAIFFVFVVANVLFFYYVNLNDILTYTFTMNPFYNINTIHSSNFCSLVVSCCKSSNNQMLKSCILQKYNNPSTISIFISFFHSCISQGNYLHIHNCFCLLVSQSLLHCNQLDVYTFQSKDAALPRNNGILCVENFEKSTLILIFHAQCLFLQHSLPLAESI